MCVCVCVVFLSRSRRLVACRNHDRNFWLSMGGDGFQTQRRKSRVLGQISAEMVLADATAIDGRKEWICCWLEESSLFVENWKWQTRICVLFCLRELNNWFERCPCSFRGVAYGKDTFASGILSVAHDLGVQDPVDTMRAVEMWLRASWRISRQG